MAPPEEGRDRRRQQLAARVLPEVVACLAAGRTFSELGMEELITSARTSRTTFYKTFSGKGDLLAYGLAQIVDEIDALASPWWLLEGGVDAARLGEVLGAVADGYRPHAALVAAAKELAPQDPVLRAAVDELFSRGTAELAAHIRRGQAGGWVAGVLDPEVTAGFVAIAIEAAAQRAAQLEDRTEAERLLAEQAQLVWHVLYA